jgi:hypothetical protein
MFAVIVRGYCLLLVLRLLILLDKSRTCFAMSSNNSACGLRYRNTISTSNLLAVKSANRSRQGSDCNNSLSFITRKTLYDTTAPVVFISYFSEYIYKIVKSWFHRVQIDYSDTPLTVEIRNKPFSLDRYFVVWISPYDVIDFDPSRHPPKTHLRDIIEYKLGYGISVCTTPSYIDFGTWSCLLLYDKRNSFSNISPSIWPDKYSYFTHAGKRFTLGLDSIDSRTAKRRVSDRLKWTDDGDDTCQVVLGRIVSTLEWLSKKLEYVSVMTVLTVDCK